MSFRAVVFSVVVPAWWVLRVGRGSAEAAEAVEAGVVRVDIW